MKVAILSGKGGTGKTTLSVNLFSYKDRAMLLDCDVEEPNDHLFLSGTPFYERIVTKRYPIVDETMCIHCERCGDFCQFNAIVPTKQRILIYDDLCHDCGGCQLVCPTNAIHYSDKPIGTIKSVRVKENKQFIYGTLEVGEVSGVNVIQDVKNQPDSSSFTIIDCPPGTSCSTVHAVKDADYAIIVTEPTVFGKSDMALVVELLDTLQIPRGIVINKSDHKYDYIIEDYADEQSISILGKIPFNKEIASLIANGNTVLHHTVFKEALSTIVKRLDGELHA